ncbi:metallophosphoesterase [Synechococcus sp. CC9311]|uniref:metallophosphoesterase family protein n=1 Tax=Synechococcus sp. (strain CC9311) TaxID=64471 RepID=UPI001ED96926|nr:metallophosphoesterase [Synechococcus sp. CC9311]
MSPSFLHAVQAAPNQKTFESVAVLERGNLRLALISDLNGPYGSTIYSPTVATGFDLLSELKPDLVLCAGDMVAGQKISLTDSQLEAMWSSFQSTILNPLLQQGIGMIPTMGNHDASSQKWSSQYVFARERHQAESFWARQKNRLGLEFIDAKQYPFQFSVKQPGLFVIVIDASSATVDRGQRQWLEQALTSESRSSDDCCVVMGHLPLTAISHGRDRAGECIEDAVNLTDLMQRHRVDLYLSGHHHAWYPGELRGQRLLSLGAMGNGPRRLLGTQRTSDPSLTLLDLFPATKTVRETTFSLKTLEPISLNSLPKQLSSKSFPTLDRRDTSWSYGS